jgi:hypothetical protein
MQSTGTMEERIVPFPNIATALIMMMTYYLFMLYRIFGEAEAAGVKPP